MIVFKQIQTVYQHSDRRCLRIVILHTVILRDCV